MKKPNNLWLDEMSTNEVQEAVANGTVVIFPVGSVEEHGKHLPLCTDSLQAEYIALEVAKLSGCLVAPAFRHGICNAGRNFPGTISIEFDTLYHVARDILSELARNGFYRIIVLSGHAGSSHMTALKLAAQDIIRKNDVAQKRIRIMVLSDYDFIEDLTDKLDIPKRDGHAGAVETSRVMAINGDLVKAEGEASFPQMPRFEVVAHPEKYFPSGVMGDPTKADTAKGHELNKYIISEVVKLVEEIKKN